MEDTTLNQPAAPGPEQVAPQMTPSTPPPQQAQGQPQLAPQPEQKGSLWKNLLVGAVTGLANSGGATSFGGGMGAGAQGVMRHRAQQQEMDLAQQREQRLAQAQQSENIFRDAQAANFVIEAKMKEQQLANLPEALRQKAYESEGKLAQQLIQGGYMPSEIVDDDADAAMDGLRRGAANSPDGKLGNRFTLHVGGKILAFDLDNSHDSVLGILNRSAKLLGMPEVDTKGAKGLPPQLRSRLLSLFHPVPTGKSGQVAEYKEYVAKARMLKDPEMIADMESAYNAVLEAYNHEKQNKMEEMEARGRAFGANRPVTVINPQTQELEYQYAKDAIGKASPASGGVKAMSAQAQMREMKAASTQLRTAINRLDKPFTPDQISMLTIATRHNDPGIVRKNIKALVNQQLTPPQKAFVLWANQLNERALSLRGVAGMGQGAQDLREAIQATLPGAADGDKQFMLDKLAAFDNQVDLLWQGVPKVKGQESGAPQTNADPLGIR